MDPQRKKTLGKGVGGCGCLLLLLITAWMCFVAYIGLQGRGNDEEAAVILGAVTCACTIPIVVLTAIGLYVGLRKASPDSPG